MKRVSFETAKALEKAGYPQNPYNDTLWFNLNGEQISDDAVIDGDVDIDAVCAAPTYFEVWLWLWREKRLRITTELTNVGLKTYINNVALDYYQEDDPEETIISAINYIVDNNLIKYEMA